jgi:hypothetical protein
MVKYIWGKIKLRDKNKNKIKNKGTPYFLLPKYKKLKSNDG